MPKSLMTRMQAACLEYDEDRIYSLIKKLVPELSRTRVKAADNVVPINKTG